MMKLKKLNNLAQLYNFAAKKHSDINSFMTRSEGGFQVLLF